VAETFSDVRCPLALVLDSPLLPLHVLPVGSQVTHLTMVKHILKITKRKNCYVRRKKSNTCTNEQTHEK
jgi:hypothetical protein